MGREGGVPHAGDDLHPELFDNVGGATFNMLHAFCGGHVLGLLVDLSADCVNLVLDGVRRFHCHLHYTDL